MNVQTQRTHGNWRIGDAGHAVFGPKNNNPAPETVATCLKRANAAFIVRACNSHDALVTALRNFSEWAADNFEEFGADISAQLLCLENDARAALKAAG